MSSNTYDHDEMSTLKRQMSLMEDELRDLRRIVEQHIIVGPNENSSYPLEMMENSYHDLSPCEGQREIIRTIRNGNDIDQTITRNGDITSDSGCSDPPGDTINNNLHEERQGIWSKMYVAAILFGKKYYSEKVENTKTIHMYTIATYADAIQATKKMLPKAQRKRRKSIFFAFLSMMIVCIQLAVLSFAVYESSIPTCTTHTDCDIGRFCLGAEADLGVFRQPRCASCSGVSTYYANSIMNSTCEIPNKELGFDHTVLWFSSNGKSNTHSNEGCLAMEYCESTELYGRNFESDKYGQLTLTINMLSHDQIFVLLFIAILFGGTISEDLTEAEKENAFLEIICDDSDSLQYTRVLDRNESGVSKVEISINDSSKFWMHLALKMIRMSLRIRQVVLPWSIALATIGVLLADSLSTRNILLNFMAVTFLVQADNALTVVLFSSKQHEFVDKMFKIYSFGGEDKNQQEQKEDLSEQYFDTNSHQSEQNSDDLRHSVRQRNNQVSCLWPKLSGFVVAITVVVCVSWIDSLLNVDCKGCHRLSKILLVISYVGSPVSGILWSWWHMRKRRILTEASFSTFLLEFARSHSAIMFNIWYIGLSLLPVLVTGFWRKNYGNMTLLSFISFISFVIMEIGIEQFRNHIDSQMHARIILITCWFGIYALCIWTILIEAIGID